MNGTVVDTVTEFETRRMRSGQVVAVGRVADLEAARRSSTRVVLRDPAGTTATARISALGRSFLPAGRGQVPLAYGYLCDVQVEVGL